MSLFTKVLFFGALLVLLEVPDGIISARFGGDPTRQPKPHEVWDNCGTWCADTCEHRTREGESCIAMCNPDWVCSAGYIREAPNGNCILPNECPPHANP